MEGTILIVLDSCIKKLSKNMGYLVLLLNLGKFFTLPYGDFFLFVCGRLPLLSFDMNQNGMIYIFMLISFYGLIPFIRSKRSEWARFDLAAYNTL